MTKIDIFSGFLGCEEQIDIVKNFIYDKKAEPMFYFSVNFFLNCSIIFDSILET